MNRNSNNEADDSQKESGDVSNDTNRSSKSGYDIDCDQYRVTDFSTKDQSDAPNDPKHLPLFKGDVVCFHEIFEWLSLEDIHTVGQTCQRLQAIAGDFIKCYLQAANLLCCNGGIRIIPGGFLYDSSAVVQKVAIEGDDAEPYRYMQLNCKSLKRIDFREAVITTDRAKQIESILEKVEIIQLTNCDVRGDFYDCFLKFCTNLKHLIVDDNKPEHILIGTDNQWLSRSYPTIDHVEFNVLYYSKMNKILELTLFFEYNSHIQSLATDLIGLLHMQIALKQSQVRLCNLGIAFDDFCSTVDEDAAISLLVELRDRYIYNRLHIYDNHPVYMYTKLSDRTFKKILLGCDGLCNIMTDLSLNGFDLIESGATTDVKMLAENLLKLERLNIVWLAGLNDILPFIQHSVNLKIIAIKYFDGHIIDLPALNKARGKLPGAQKVTVYVGEKVFLATKWSSKATDLEYIELRRIDSYEWVHYSTSSVL